MTANANIVVRKDKKGKYFRMMHTHPVDYGGIQFRNSYWIECDKDGNIGDGNKDGVVENKTLLCKIPKGKADIDMASLSENCLK